MNMNYFAQFVVTNLILRRGMVRYGLKKFVPVVEHNLDTMILLVEILTIGLNNGGIYERNGSTMELHSFVNQLNLRRNGMQRTNYKLLIKPNKSFNSFACFQDVFAAVASHVRQRSC
jgi:hypothetical protein